MRIIIIMLKNLPIIPSQTFQNFNSYFKYRIAQIFDGGKY